MYLINNAKIVNTLKVLKNNLILIELIGNFSDKELENIEINKMIIYEKDNIKYRCLEVQRIYKFEKEYNKIEMLCERI